MAKVTSALAASGCGKVHSKHLGQLVLSHRDLAASGDPNPLIEHPATVNNPAKFDPERFTVFTNCDGGILAPFLNQVSEAMPGMSDKMTSFSDYLQEHEHMGGAHGPLGPSMFHAELGGLFDDLQYGSEVGAQPWLAILRRNQLRRRPDQLPLPGMASLYYSMTHEAIAQSVPMASLLKRGIAAEDVNKFLESSAGEKVQDEEAGATILPKCTACYVPPGHLPQVAFYVEAEGNRGQNEEGGDK